MRLLEAALQPGSEALLAKLLLHEPEGRAPAATVPDGAGGRDERAKQHAVRPGGRLLDVAALAERLRTNPACYAVRHSSPAALKLLLAAGCPADGVPAGCGEVPLLVAAGRLDIARCRLLLAAGASADAPNGQGESALDIVLSLCTDTRLVSRQLLQAGAGGQPCL